MKIRIKLTLLQTFGLCVATILILAGGWLIGLIVGFISIPYSFVDINDQDAFIHIDFDTRE